MTNFRYKLCKKFDLFDWIDDHVIWYIWDKPIDWYKTVRCWWYCDVTNPYHWKFVWYTLFHNRPWADTYLYEVMKLQLQKQLYYFENRVHLISDYHKNEAIRWMQLCIKLIDILNENVVLWDYDIDDPTKTTHEDRYSCLVKVNTKNYKRFALLGYNYENPPKMVRCEKYLLNEPHELYKQKAKVLLARILYTKSDLWWD